MTMGPSRLGWTGCGGGRHRRRRHDDGAFTAGVDSVVAVVDTDEDGYDDGAYG